MTQKKSKGVIAEKKNEIMGSLKTLGTQIYDQLDSGNFPTITMPSRSTENIHYDPDVRQYILGDKSVTRSARNIRHVKPFTQLAWAAMFSNELTFHRKTSTLRDVYYSAQAYNMTFKDQQESNNIITDLETATGFAREDFHIFPVPGQRERGVAMDHDRLQVLCPHNRAAAESVAALIEQSSG